MGGDDDVAESVSSLGEDGPGADVHPDELDMEDPEMEINEDRQHLFDVLGHDTSSEVGSEDDYCSQSKNLGFRVLGLRGRFEGLGFRIHRVLRYKP